MLPGPKFWLIAYILLDFGSVFPYVAANTATPLAAVIVGEIPKLDKTYEVLGVDDDRLRRCGCALQYVCFLLIMLPMIFGGKAYNSVKAVMNVKIVVVLGFLLFVAICYSTADTWREIITGFFRFGAVPTQPTTPGGAPGMDNIFFSLWEGRGLPNFDFSMIAMLGALAAISGNGGLTNTTTSAYTRDQGWGMGQKVGAVPSIIGGRKLTLSHTGMVFPITRESIARFRGWYQRRAARPAHRVDAGLLRRRRAAQHAVRAVPAAQHRGERVGRRRHDRRRPAPRPSGPSGAACSGT